MKRESVFCAIAILLVYVVAGCGQGSRPGSSATISEMKPTEGMWLPTALPTERLARLGFTPTNQWPDHLRLSSVNVGGASGAFVSADGLVLTNHHVASGGLQSISRAGKDYLSDGFLAASRDQEIPLPGVELKVLFSIQDVTDRVNGAVAPNLPPDQAAKARRAVLADISRESQEQTGLQSNVVTLFGGARYHLYRYKRFTDVRVAFAPEASTAFFGGDPDNFEYPRYDLDITLVRAYENGKPAHVDHFLHVSPAGVSEGELVFVSGHPGRTDRLLTVSTLEAQRDRLLPLRLESLERSERAVIDYGKRGDEEHRQAQNDLFGIQNSLKALRPRLAVLQGDLMNQKRQEEASLREALRGRKDLAGYDAAWDRIAQANKETADLVVPMTMLDGANAFRTRLFDYARELVRLPVEDAKPDDQRLREYTKANRAHLEDELLAARPFYPALEIAKLTASLEFMRDRMGADSPMVQKVLIGKSPADRARELVAGTKLADPAERKRLKEGAAVALDASQDSMILLARLVDDDSRRLFQTYETKLEEPQTRAMTQINLARFALLGDRIYPDATGTLRLAFGLVKGYEQAGQKIAPWTTMGGAFDHEKQQGAAPPFKLPQSWTDARGKLALQTPLNFVSTADITGGNSGSPVVNRAGEFVGIIFDSNRQGITTNFDYSDAQARAVSVDIRAILEAMKTIYHADGLVGEMTGAHP